MWHDKVFFYCMFTSVIDQEKKILWYLKLLLLAILNDPTIKGYFYFFKSFPFDQPNPFFVIKRASLKRG